MQKDPLITLLFTISFNNLFAFKDVLVSLCWLLVCVRAGVRLNNVSLPTL